jgi:hypothetical protein
VRPRRSESLAPKVPFVGDVCPAVEPSAPTTIPLTRLRPNTAHCAKGYRPNVADDLAPSRPDVGDRVRRKAAKPIASVLILVLGSGAGVLAFSATPAAAKRPRRSGATAAVPGWRDGLSLGLAPGPNSELAVMTARDVSVCRGVERRSDFHDTN